MLRGMEAAAAHENFGKVFVFQITKISFHILKLILFLHLFGIGIESIKPGYILYPH